MRVLRSARGAALAVGFLCAQPAGLALGQAGPAPQGAVTRFAFLEALARLPLGAKLLPEDAQQLDDARFYREVAERLAARGARALAGRAPGDPLTRAELTEVAYVLAGGRPGASYAEQKHFLKQKGILDPKDIGHVRAFQGEVTVKRAGSEKPVKVTGAEPVLLRDLEETSFNAKLELQFDDLSLLSMGEETVLEVSEMVYDPKTQVRSVALKLSLGTLRVLASRAAGRSRFEVTTPTAVIGERGTEFIVSVDRAGGTRVITLAGEVSVRPLGGGRRGRRAGAPGAGMAVGPDQSVRVSPEGILSRPAPLTEAERREALRATSPTGPVVVTGGGPVTPGHMVEVLRNLTSAPLVVETYVPPGGEPPAGQPPDADEEEVPEMHEPEVPKDSLRGERTPSREETPEDVSGLPGGDLTSFCEGLTASEKSELVGLLGGFEVEMGPVAPRSTR